MPVEKAELDIGSLVTRVSSGEIKLPEIQRGYVWKPTQVARLMESLYRGYPSGSLLLWRTLETPETRAVAIEGPSATPLVLPLYLLDGQQRLTSLHRVLTDHVDAQVVFNIETEAFQNQSAATKKDPRWVKVFDLTRHDADLLEMRDKLATTGVVDSKVLGQRLTRISSIPSYSYHLEIITALPYEEVAQIFVRVNSGGRTLKTTDLALATLSARWPGVLGKIEEEATHWRKRDYGDLDVTFLTRALTGAVLGRGLSAWSHGRLAAASDEELEAGWSTVRRGLRHLVPLLKSNLDVSHSHLLPSVNVLLPLVVLLGERPDEPLGSDAANGILYWFLVATIRNRYSSSADTLLGQDIPAVRQADPVATLLRNLGVHGGNVEVTEQALTGRTVGSPYFFLSFLIARQDEAKDWWYGAKVSATAEGTQKLEYHHIHPRATLKADFLKAEINDLANLAFISGKANRKISDRSPRDYFPTLDNDELDAHLVPRDERLREVPAYLEFLAARRRLLATAMTGLLGRFRPQSLDESSSVVADELEGHSLALTLYGAGADTAELEVVSRIGDGEWRTMIGLSGLDAALSAAQSGLDGDLEIAGETMAVRVRGDDIEIPLGPLIAVGSAKEWKAALDRERDDARPVSQRPTVNPPPWAGPRVRFPIASSD